MPQLWRIHIRPGGDEPNPAKSYAFCLRKEVIGVGWGVASDGPLTLEHYLELCGRLYPGTAKIGKRAVSLLHSMANGDLVWMRGTHGVYHLCMVVGPWTYRGSPEFEAVDIVNTVRVEIAEVGVEIHVPGNVISSFKSPQLIRHIDDDTALAVSTLIWNRVTGSHMSVECPHFDIFSLLSAKDCEDLISVYLQMQGWIIYAARRRSDTTAYEFVLRHRSNFKEAVVEVRTGRLTIDLGALPSSVDVVFAFQPNGQYIGKNPKAVLIGRDDLLNFISANPRLIPDVVSQWATEWRSWQGRSFEDRQPHHL
jgi:hypothetical protein